MPEMVLKKADMPGKTRKPPYSIKHITTNCRYIKVPTLDFCQPEDSGPRLQTQAVGAYASCLNPHHRVVHVTIYSSRINWKGFLSIPLRRAVCCANMIAQPCVRLYTTTVQVWNFTCLCVCGCCSKCTPVFGLYRIRRQIRTEATCESNINNKDERNNK